jgi:hypothetical protein
MRSTTVGTAFSLGEIMFKIGLIALSLSTFVSIGALADPATTITPPIGTTHPATAAMGTHSPMAPTTNVKGKPTALNPHDCDRVGGTVIYVQDDRCGSTHLYCKIPNVTSVCIDSTK